MSTWWDSIDTVSRINNWMHISIIVFGVLTAIASALAFVAANRITSLENIEKLALRKELEQARTDAVSAVQTASKIAEEQKPRSLSDALRQSLATSLRPYRGTPIDVVTVLGDGESFIFAEQIETVLKQAGWKSNGVSQAVFSGHPVGLILVVRSQKEASRGAGALQHIFGQNGFEVQGEINPSLPIGSLKLIVGYKS